MIDSNEERPAANAGRFWLQMGKKGIKLGVKRKKTVD